MREKERNVIFAIEATGTNRYPPIVLSSYRQVEVAIVSFASGRRNDISLRLLLAVLLRFDKASEKNSRNFIAGNAYVPLIIIFRYLLDFSSLPPNEVTAISSIGWTF